MDSQGSALSGCRAEPGPSSFKICVGSRDLAGDGTGIATYARALLCAIQDGGGIPEVLESAAASRVRRYYLAATRRQVSVGTDLFRVAQVHFDIWRRLLGVVGGDRIDLMHWTSPLPLRMVGVPNVYTFHDAIPLRQPNLTGTDAGRFRRLLRTIAVSADHVLTVSEATRAEILGVVPELAGRISVIPQVVAPAPVQAADEVARVAWAQAGCAPGGYFLFCGSIEPRKNVPALVQAFHASGSVRRLVLAGPDGYRAREELDGLVGGPIVRVGYLERGDLLALMRGARALLYPSLAEGFGLPIIEAMGIGTPVLTSRGGATEEVAGDAALLVDPADPAALAAAIVRLDGDDALCAELGRRGAVVSQNFRPALYARRLAAFYRLVISGDKTPGNVGSASLLQEKRVRNE